MGIPFILISFKIRLEGIDAPEMKQKCKKEFLKISSYIGFIFYKDYNCGRISKKLKIKSENPKLNVYHHQKIDIKDI